MKTAIIAATLLFLLTGCAAVSPVPTTGPEPTEPAPAAPAITAPATETPEPSPEVSPGPRAATAPPPEPPGAAGQPGPGPTDEQNRRGPDERGYPEDNVGPEVRRLYDAGMDAAARRDLPEAARLMRQAQEEAGGGSGHLEMMLGRLNALLDRRQAARERFEASLRIRDDGFHRVLYAMQLEEWGDCEAARIHAGTALERATHTGAGRNTHAEAHQVLALCAWAAEEIDLGHLHMSEAHRLARQSGYSLAVPDGGPDAPEGSP